MKLKHHLWIAFGIIVIALFLTSVISATVVPALNVDKDSTTTIWNLMWENLFTTIPTDDVAETLTGLGIPETMALDLIEENGTGNSVLSGLLGLLPILVTLAGVLLVTFKDDVKKWLLYGSFGLIFVSVWTIWFTAPTKLNGVESMYNSLNAINPAFPAIMGTMMKDGTELTMGIGLFVASIGALYGIVALVLNQYGKIAE
jgi:hypothetical protein